MGEIDVPSLDRDLHRFAPPDALRTLAATGIRGEFAFPTPLLLSAAPKLLGYYRLLLGRSQKAFYGADGFGPFKSMEIVGTLGSTQKRRLPTLCRTLGEALGALVIGITPGVAQRDLDELPLLTLGAQFQGANNVEIGKTATKAVFIALKDMLKPNVVEESASKIVVRNAAGRRVTLTLAHDPDVRIDEDVKGNIQRKVAIEIKGGADVSNAHNRIGEAEKSHQKAASTGYRNLWTMITLKGLDVAKLKRESPTTTRFIDLAQILAGSGADWETTRMAIAAEVGIPMG